MVPQAKTETGDHVLAGALGQFAEARQGLAHHRRHPDAGSRTRRRHADKRLVEEIADHALEGCQRKQGRGRRGDRAGDDAVLPGVVDRLVVGLAGLDLLGIGRRQVLRQAHRADPETGADQPRDWCRDRSSRPSRGADRSADRAAAETRGHGRGRVPDALA
jgi:hypothetical protein